MVDAFIETGNAATDLGDIVGSVAKKMAAGLIKSLYIKPILDQYSKEIENISLNSDLGKEEKTLQSLSVFDKAVAAIAQQADDINATMNKLSGFWEGMDANASETLANGIKGVTEDTANLLASYLNAMRADLSGVRQLQAQHLPIISGAMPTIMDHLAKIQAHTYDTSQYTGQMLTRLTDIYDRMNDVITSEGGSTSIRTIS